MPHRHSRTKEAMVLETSEGSQYEKKNIFNKEKYFK